MTHDEWSKALDQLGNRVHRLKEQIASLDGRLTDEEDRALAAKLLPHCLGCQKSLEELARLPIDEYNAHGVKWTARMLGVFASVDYLQYLVNQVTPETPP